MDLINDDLLRYAELHSDAEPELLQKINRDTQANVLMPRMLSGHLQGRVLAMISKMVRPKTILEIGTYTGYSALCLAEGLTDDGKLITIDINEELESKVRDNFKLSGLSEKIEYLIGNALELIPSISQSLDLVFIDADKINYVNYYDLVFEKLSAGGIILADNVLWSGKVLSEKPDKDTRAIIEFNRKVRQDRRVETVVLPIRDGITIIRKRSA